MCLKHEATRSGKFCRGAALSVREEHASCDTQYLGCRGQAKATGSDGDVVMTPCREKTENPRLINRAGGSFWPSRKLQAAPFSGAAFWQTKGVRVALRTMPHA